MIYNANKYFSRKQQIRLFKNSLKNEIVKLALFVIICVLVASLVSKSSAQTSYTFYYAQNKIVNKHTRGVYPPLEGRIWNLYGCWAIAGKIGSQSINLDQFKNYQLCFQQSGRLSITKAQPQCKLGLNLLIFEWRAYSHNLFVSQSKAIYIDQQKNDSKNLSGSKNQQIYDSSNSRNNLTANPQGPQKDRLLNTPEGNKTRQGQVQQNSQISHSQCLNSSDPISVYASSFTVWTLRDSRIYLISEAYINNRIDISIFVLQSIY